MALRSGEQIVEKMLPRAERDIFLPPRPLHGEEVLLQAEGLEG